MDQYTFSGNTKKFTFALMGIGVLALIYGLIDSSISADRIWSNVLINGFFFLSIALCGTFHVALQYASEAAWSTVLKRIFEAVSLYMPLGALVLILVFLVGSFHGHHIYHWMDPELYDLNSEHYDPLIAGKKAYLNLPFFWIRTLVYLGVWIFFTRLFRKMSLQEDVIGGTKLHFKTRSIAATFLVILAVTSTTSSWDWLMSIDTHWFSTIFGWYVFSGTWISGIIVFILLAIYLKKKGYLQQVNEHHLHDLGKWMFAISFLWSYMWYCQYMLIWYSNIPEEVTYFQARVTDYKVLFFTMFIINFAFPMLILMSRDSKRNYKILTVVGLLIFAGHWLDVYIMVTPGVLKGGGSIGIMEVGMFLGFSGMFIFAVLRALAKAPLVVKSHPYLDESIHHKQ